MTEIHFAWRRPDLFVMQFLYYSRPRAIALMSAVPAFFIIYDQAAEGFRRFDAWFVIAVLGALFLVLTACFWVASLFLGALVIAIRPGEFPGILGEHVIRLAPEGLYEETSVNATTHAWKAVARVQRKPAGVLLQSPTFTFLIPCRYFKSVDEADRFVACAHTFMRQQ